MYKVDFLSSRLSLSAHLSLSTRSEWNMLHASCPSTEQCVEQFTSKAPIAASVDGSRFARRPPSRSVINDLRSSCDSHGSNETPTLFGRAVPSPSVSLCSRTSLGPRSSLSLSLRVTKLAFNPSFLLFLFLVLFALTLRSQNSSSPSLLLSLLPSVGGDRDG